MKRSLRLRTETLRPLDRGALAGAAGASILRLNTARAVCASGSNTNATSTATAGPPPTYLPSVPCSVTFG